MRPSRTPFTAWSLARAVLLGALSSVLVLAFVLPAACVPYDAARDDEGFSVRDKDKGKDKDKAAKKDKGKKGKADGAEEDEAPAPVRTGKPSKKEAYASRWLDDVTRAKCEAGPLVLDRSFDVTLIPGGGGSPGTEELMAQLELCGPAGPMLPDAGKLRLVWSKGGSPVGETACTLPDIPSGFRKGPENPAPVSCPGNVVKLAGPGEYGLDVYLGDVLLRESKFQVVSTDVDGKKVLSIDKRVRYLEAWLGVRTDADGWPDRSGLEIRLPTTAHDTVIHTWFRDGKTIRKAREVPAAEFDGERVWLEGPKIHNVLSKDGDYEVNVAVAGTAARTAFFSVKKGKLRLHPKQEEAATRRIIDRYLLVEVTVHGFASGAEAIPPATLATFGLYGKGW